MQHALDAEGHPPGSMPYSQNRLAVFNTDPEGLLSVSLG